MVQGRAQRFSTDALAAGDRYDAWRSLPFPSFASLTESQPIDGPFQASIETLMLGAMPVTFTEITGQTYARDQSRARRDGIDSYGVMIMLEGRFAGDAAGTTFSGGAGAMLIGDFARTTDQMSSDARTITIALDRRVAEAAIPQIAGLHGHVIPAATAAIATDFLMSVRRNLSGLPVERHAMLGEIATQLLGVAVNAETGAERPAETYRNETLFWRASRLIELQIAARDLSADLICAKLRVSRSALYRVFASVGGVSRFILEKRLERASRLLVRTGSSDTVERVAMSCGFRTHSDFARAFRKAYGQTPTEYRKCH